MNLKSKTLKYIIPSNVILFPIEKVLFEILDVWSKFQSLKYIKELIGYITQDIIIELCSRDYKSRMK